MPRIPAADPQTSVVDIANCLWAMALGRTHNVGTFTITAASATTTVSDKRVKVGDVIHVTPLDSAAATKVAAGGFYVPAVSQADADANQFTVNHATDATQGSFGYTYWGE